MPINFVLHNYYVKPIVHIHYSYMFNMLRCSFNIDERKKSKKKPRPFPNCTIITLNVDGRLQLIN